MSLEKNDILQAIRDTGATVSDKEITGGSISRAAKKLGVSRRTLQARMRFYGIPMGKAGRRFKKIAYGRVAQHYSRHAKAYNTVAAVAVVVGGVTLLGRKAPKTFTPT
jgi:hypothetical protein